MRALWPAADAATSADAVKRKKRKGSLTMSRRATCGSSSIHGGVRPASIGQGTTCASKLAHELFRHVRTFQPLDQAASHLLLHPASRGLRQPLLLQLLPLVSGCAVCGRGRLLRGLALPSAEPLDTFTLLWDANPANGRSEPMLWLPSGHNGACRPGSGFAVDEWHRVSLEFCWSVSWHCSGLSTGRS